MLVIYENTEYENFVSYAKQKGFETMFRVLHINV